MKKCHTDAKFINIALIRRLDGDVAKYELVCEGLNFVIDAMV